MPQAKRRLTFEQWKAYVDAIIENRMSLTSDDLPDWDYYSAYADGMTPSAAATYAIRNAKDY